MCVSHVPRERARSRTRREWTHAPLVNARAASERTSRESCARVSRVGVCAWLEGGGAEGVVWIVDAPRGCVGVGGGGGGWGLGKVI